MVVGMYLGMNVEFSPKKYENTQIPFEKSTIKFVIVNHFND